MKKILSFCLMLVLMLMSISYSIAEQYASEEDVITIQMSEEAKQYEETSIVADGVKAALSEAHFEETMLKLSKRSEQSFPDCTLQNKLAREECEGSKVYTLTHEDYENVILYIHGGGWVFDISAEHVNFCDALATRLNAKVYMPLYPLAPQAKSEETYRMIESLYKEVLKEGKTVYIMGDSAGGNITLGLMYTIKQEGLTKPAKMILISPCADMTFTNEAMKELDKTDPELSFYGCSRCAERWAGKENLQNPKNSAVYADVTGYPDTMFFLGTNDILCPDNLILCDHMKEAGVNVTLVKGEGLWHVFPIYPIPERDIAIDLIETFCLE